MIDRYRIHNVRWKRTGPRSGFRRRRGWQQRIWNIGSAQDLAVAAALLADAPLRYDEVNYLYDVQNQGRRIAARYGQGWKGD